MIVAKNNQGDFDSVQAAIDSIPSSNTTWCTIYIKNGVYKEKIHITSPYIRLIGESADKTIITYDDYAYKLFPTGESYGTFNSYTMFVGTSDFHAENLCIENSSGIGDKVGQAIAAYVDGDRVCFKNCRFIGYQDTLFTGPLPPKPIVPGSFRGPRENAPRINGRQYYENCYIQGDIDFIFGSATAFFYSCTIFSNDIGKKVNGYITAPSTPEGQAYGYVFEDCKITSHCPKHTVYLGRPWRHFAKSVFINCDLGAHIIPAGWHNWDKPDSEKVNFFGEYNNKGPGYTPTERVNWSHLLSDIEAKHYSRQNVLNGSDNWTPWS